MVFAAAGLSSLEDNDFCNTSRGSTGTVESSFQAFPPGRDCTVTLATGRVETREGGNALGFFAILAAGLALIGIRRSRLAVTTAATFGVTGLTALVVAQVPAFGFGWLVGGLIGFHFTRSHPAWMTAAAALAVGGILQIAGAGWVGWTLVLLALIAVPTPYDER